MHCPICCQPMYSGHIVSTQMPRLVPGIPEGASAQVPAQEMGRYIPDPDDGSFFLDVHYTGITPWICKNVVCRLIFPKQNKEESL